MTASPLPFDVSLRHAAKRLPRYTSYPTANHFTALAAETAASWLGDIGPGESLSLYVHVPFCAALCAYCGCTTQVVHRQGPLDRYTAAILAEIERTRARLPGRLAVRRLHWGGGTPTRLGPERLAAIDQALRAAFAFEPSAEIAVEVDPRDCGDSLIQALLTIGTNRISLGVQTFDPDVQAAIGRIQPVELVAGVLQTFRRAGLSSVNFDLLYGLPLQTLAVCEETVRQALALRPQRLAVFGYAHLPTLKPHQRLLEAYPLPDCAERLAAAAGMARLILDAGYEAVGFDHFALPDDPLAKAARTGRLHRNFQGYTDDDSRVLLGFGASAISALPRGFVQNQSVTRDYLASMETGLGLAAARGLELSPEDRVRALIIEELMCRFSVDLDAVASQVGQDASLILEETDEALNALVADGLIRREGSRIEVRPTARSLVRCVAAIFDARLARRSSSGHAMAA